MDCVFCKIVAGEIPSKKLYEDEKVYAFYDIAPAAPVHFLVIPKTHDLTSAKITATLWPIFLPLSPSWRVNWGWKTGTALSRTVARMPDKRCAICISMSWPAVRWGLWLKNARRKAVGAGRAAQAAALLLCRFLSALFAVCAVLAQSIQLDMALPSTGGGVGSGCDMAGWP